MDLHQLKPKTLKPSSKRIGRGGKRGTTSGRGTKGQKSRSGHKMRPAIRDLMMKIPKSRGFRFKSLKDDFAVLSLSVLENVFNPGEKVNPSTLVEKGIISFKKGGHPKVKILAVGRLTKKLILENVAVSKKVANKVLALGGEIRNPE